MLPRKLPKQRMMPPKSTAPIRCPGHYAEVKGLECSVAGKLKPPHHECQYENGKSDGHHTTTRGAGGGDETLAPLCRYHHSLLDSPGWSQKRMEQEAGISFAAISSGLWQRGNAANRYRKKQENGR